MATYRCTKSMGYSFAKNCDKSEPGRATGGSRHWRVAPLAGRAAGSPVDLSSRVPSGVQICQWGHHLRDLGWTGGQDMTFMSCEV